MFVYIIGNVEQNVFQLGIAEDPFKRLSSIQIGNPYRLSIISKIGVESKNAASQVEKLGRKELSEYEGMGSWFMNMPEGLLTQLVSGHYLSLLASKAGVKPMTQVGRSDRTKPAGTHRLAAVAEQNGLTFEEALEKVEQAYDQGIPIDDLWLN